MMPFKLTDLKNSWPMYEFDADTVFTEKSQATKYINILDSGERATYDNGGSTMFGYGVPDDYSIPSMFNKLQDRYRATNYGRGGYCPELESRLILNY